MAELFHANSHSWILPMTKIAKTNRSDIDRITKLVEDVIRSFGFNHFSNKPLSSQRSYFNFEQGRLYFDEKSFECLINNLLQRHPNIARSTIEDKSNNLFQDYIEEYITKQRVNWDTSFLLSDQIPDFISDQWIRSHIEQLLENLTGLVRVYEVFVPILGVSLTIPEYSFGPVKLVRTQDSLPANEQAPGIAEYKYVNQAILEHFSTVPSHVQSTITGDTVFARQEGLRLADQLMAILNLHLATWALPREPSHQKIQLSGIPSSYAMVVLVRANLPTNRDLQKPTYLPAVTKHGFIAHSLDLTQLNEIKQRGFDEIWKCFEQHNIGSKGLCERIRRAVMWFEKAVNFDEPDAQFVGLATALEILLVNKADVSNPFSTWSGITQQLADRCAFLEGHDLPSTMKVVSDVKRLYGVRSGIVHSGKEPTTDELREMVRLVSRVIIDFVEKKFSSYEAFEEWINKLKYSVNLNELKST